MGPPWDTCGVVALLLWNCGGIAAGLLLDCVLEGGIAVVLLGDHCGIAVPALWDCCDIAV